MLCGKMKGPALAGGGGFQGEQAWLSVSPTVMLYGGLAPPTSACLCVGPWLIDS